MLPPVGPANSKRLNVLTLVLTPIIFERLGFPRVDSPLVIRSLIMPRVIWVLLVFVSTGFQSHLSIPLDLIALHPHDGRNAA